MILFADAEARVVGAAHAGWRGALAGVVEATVAAMAGLGAVPARVCAALGPCIAQASYEVGPEFVAAFAAADADWARFFIPSVEEGRSMFDLHGYIAARAARAGVGDFEDSASTPMPTRRASSAIAARRTAGSRTTGGWSRRSRSPEAAARTRLLRFDRVSNSLVAGKRAGNFAESHAIR